MGFFDVLSTIAEKAGPVLERRMEQYRGELRSKANETMKKCDEYEAAHPRMTSEQREKVEEARNKASRFL